jgi:predicted transcriptional regulator
VNEEGETLRAAILQRHKTLYAFCKAARLPRGTVYQVIRGRYAGDAAKQLARIRKALEAAPQEGGPELEKIKSALAQAACARCGNGKRRCRKTRHNCRALWTDQAGAILDLLEAGK